MIDTRPQFHPPDRVPQGIGRFLRFSLIYSLGDLLAKGARILLIPIYLSVLTPAEVGELAILQAIIFCTWTLLGFGLAYAAQKYYHDYGADGDSMFGTVWLARLIAGLPFYGLLLLVGWGLNQMTSESLALPSVLLAITAGYLKGGINIVEFWLNIREEPVRYRAFTFFQFLLTSVLIITFVVVFKLGVFGAILGELVSYMIFAFISAFMLFRKSLPNLRIVRWRELLSYSLPVLPHAFFMWGLTGIDRLILNEYVQRADIGIYAIGCLLASYLSIVVQSMRSAWLPAFFRNATGADSQAEFGRIASIYLCMTFFAALAGMLFAPEIIYVFSLAASASYDQSARIMQIVLFGFVNMALFIALNQPLLFERRTGLLSAISGAGILGSVLLNLWLIPRFGIWGAAIANVFSYALMTMLTFYFTRQIYKVRWEANALILTTILFLGFSVLAWQFPTDPTLRLLPVKVLLLLLFPMLVLFRIRTSPKSMIRLESRFAWTQPRAFSASS